MNRYAGTTEVPPHTVVAGSVIRGVELLDHIVEVVEVTGIELSTGDPLVLITTDWTRRHGRPPLEYGHAEARVVHLVAPPR